MAHGLAPSYRVGRTVTWSASLTCTRGGSRRWPTYQARHATTHPVSHRLRWPVRWSGGWPPGSSPTIDGRQRVHAATTGRGTGARPAGNPGRARAAASLSWGWTGRSP